MSVDERYSFTWNGKRQAKKCAEEPYGGALELCGKESVNLSGTENIYIEGDSLSALKLLREDYLKKIKMIYIDPPYNRGNDFVYADDFTCTVSQYMEKTGRRNIERHELAGRLHSKWLSMMYPRLIAARPLLCEDGVIFISIDDNEAHNLRKLCDEVFGEENFIAQIVVQTNRGGQDYNKLAKVHEYLIVYGASGAARINTLPKEDLSAFKYSDSRGSFEIRELRNRNPKFGKRNRPNLFYPFYVDSASEDRSGFFSVSTVKSGADSVEVYPYNSRGVESCWRWGMELSEANIDAGCVENSNVVARRKRDGNYNIYEKNRKTETRAKTIWDEPEVRTERGTIALRELFGYSFFDHPKPVELVSKAILLGADRDSIILDFFSGSGTTAHAVMNRNAVDGGKRRFIMVQNSEPSAKGSEARLLGYETIAAIGRERIRRAGSSLLAESGNSSLDVGFRAFKIT